MKRAVFAVAGLFLLASLGFAGDQKPVSGQKSQATTKVVSTKNKGQTKASWDWGNKGGTTASKGSSLNKSSNKAMNKTDKPGANNSAANKAMTKTDKPGANNPGTNRAMNKTDKPGPKAQPPAKEPANSPTKAK